ncbi:MAG: hypothetical protein KGZ97_05265 [Bacteroidetes bacterium]|nr:hypothetical protein [Bacteroidota bacterium]
MRNTIIIIACTLFVFAQSCTQGLKTPAEKDNFTRITLSEEVVEFSKILCKKYDFLEYKIIGNTITGKEIIAINASSGFSDDKLKVLIFAQQHGNEQSGKEALLIFLRELNNNINWLDNIEFWIAPQINPDGGDKNSRLNAQGIDLNRDHILLNARETQALHKLFQEVMPHVTIDIHEYNPFRESWQNFGAYKVFDVQVGIPTNINVSEEIRSFALYEVLPAIEKHLNMNGFSFHNYLVGPVPTEGRTRHSTVDINDGRQSFAILNTLSFIYEGINGRDGFLENLKGRTFGQYEALFAHINFINENAEKIKTIVNSKREMLVNSNSKIKVSIRMEHFPAEFPLVLHLLSSKTNNDTIIEVENFHPVVKSLHEVTMPQGYLIPAYDSLIIDIIKKHNIIYSAYETYNNHKIFAYKILDVDTVMIEELSNMIPTLKKEQLKILKDNYIYVPTAQLHSNFLVLLFEPESMLGIAQIKDYNYLLNKGEMFPILRVE